MLWVGSLKDHVVPPLAMGRDIFHQTKFLQAPSNLILSIPVRDLLQMALHAESNSKKRCGGDALSPKVSES